jgi:hypothetical protein
MATKQSKRLQLIGVVHVAPLPGSPGFAVLEKLATKRQSAWERILEGATADAKALVAGGCDALIVENFGDAPFWKDNVPSETIASLAIVIDAVGRAVEGRVPLGVNVLRNDARAALGLCAATGANFLRVNVHVGAAVTDQGLVEGRAAETVRERGRLCPWAQIWADVHVKHATPLGRETIAEAAHDTLERGLADALIVSGVATGHAPDPSRVQAVRAALKRAVIYVGSGVSEKNAAALLEHADGAIVGTALKRDGQVGERVDPKRVLRLRRAFDALRAAP